MSTCEGTNSGKTSSGARMALHDPRISAKTLKVVTAPKWRTQRLTSARITDRLLVSFRAGIGFLREKLRGCFDDDLVARFHAVGDEVAVLEWPARVYLRPDESAGLCLDITPVFVFADDRGLRRNQCAGLCGSDRRPDDNPFPPARIAAAQYRKKTASRNAGIRRRGPDCRQFPSL